MAVTLPPTKINKVFKVVEYGYLPVAVMPPGPTLLPGQTLALGLLRPVQNVAICDLFGQYVPVFCTSNWQPVPAGFDSKLEQNQSLTLERAKYVSSELLGLDVMVWYAMTEAEDEADFISRSWQSRIQWRLFHG